MESYKEKYEQALEVAKETYNTQPMYREWLEKMFPELAESEDEKVRKILFEFFKNYKEQDTCGSETFNGIPTDNILAWLEKQGEQIDIANKEYWRGYREGKKEILDKYAEIEKQNGQDILEDAVLDGNEDGLIAETIRFKNEKQSEQKSDKVEPKFKVGDKIRRKTPSSFDKDMYVARIEKDYYVCNHSKFSSEVVPFSKQSGYELIEQKPTDKEMKTLLRTEYEKGRADAIAEMQMEWSEEDELQMQAIIDLLPGLTIRHNWLKSLKDRVKPQYEWSEEDERNLQGIIDEIEANKNQAPDYDLATYDRFLSWLKSLRPQNRWKPSDEQMKALNYVVNLMASSESPKENDYYYNVFKDLRKQLKKLKENSYESKNCTQNS